jgi:succinate dehydrogenase / fumarate reductase, membrane anchor subunit
MSGGKPTRAEIRNPQTHYGRAKASTRHFLTQRVTGALNILFALFIIWFVVSLSGADTAGKMALVANPFVAGGLALLIVNVATHMRNGMRDVIEDYFEGAINRLALVANTVFALFVVVVALGALAKIVFWG